MPPLRGVPPGRAGRLWLQKRLATAERGAAMLDHKLRILRMERQRLELIADRAASAWESAATEAERWSVRAGLLGGRRGFRLGTTAPTEVTVTWSYLMGVRYPSTATCAAPVPAAATPTSSALVLAAAAHRRALQAAVEHAVAQAAARTLDAELLATRRRVRAIEDRWIPRLQGTLHQLTLELEENEHADAVRLRWAAGRVRR